MTTTIVIIVVVVVVVALAIVIAAIGFKRSRTRSVEDAPTGQVVLVLTDVADKSKLWDKYPEKMHQSMKVLTSMAANICRNNNGYASRGRESLLDLKRTLKGVFMRSRTQRLPLLLLVRSTFRLSILKSGPP